MGKRRIETGKPMPVASLRAKPVEGETELHGLDAGGAAVTLESFLSRWSHSKPGVVIRVITGRGNRSDGDPVLKPLVRDLLDGRLARYVERYTMEQGGGACLVQVR